MIAVLLIRRGEHWARFTVPFDPGLSVLDGLRHIRVHADPSLAFRYACTNANACKECMMLLNRKPSMPARPVWNLARCGWSRSRTSIWSATSSPKSPLQTSG